MDGMKEEIDGKWGRVFGDIQRPAVRRWVEDLEDASDELLADSGATNSTAFCWQVEHALMIASGLNATLDNDSNGDLARRWRQVRELLNILARACAYAPVNANPFRQVKRTWLSGGVESEN